MNRWELRELRAYRKLNAQERCDETKDFCITTRFCCKKLATQSYTFFLFFVFPHFRHHFSFNIWGIKLAPWRNVGFPCRAGVELDVYGAGYFGPSQCGWSRCEGLRRIPRCGISEVSEKLRIFLDGNSERLLHFYGGIYDKISCTEIL